MRAGKWVLNEHGIVIHRSTNAHSLRRAEIQTATQGQGESVPTLLQLSKGGWPGRAEPRARVRCTSERIGERREARAVAGFEFRSRQKVIHSSPKLDILRRGRAGGIAEGHLGGAIVVTEVG